MTATTSDTDSNPSSAAHTTVKALEGFFVSKTPVEGDQTTLFKRYEMTPSSWREFQQKIAQLDKEDENENSSRQVKIVYFLRHAEGTHNEAHTKYGSPRWEDEFARTDAFLDAPLTPFGVRDAQSKGPSSVKMELERGMPPIERVVVSPISRAIQTAQNFFTKDQVPREPFPDIDFSRMKDEEDQLWSTTHRETKEEIRERARAFLLELFSEIPERYVVVAAHLSIIEAICAVATGSDTRVLPSNCEVVPMVLEAIQ
ncbi:hypothetical protein BBJ29_006504 [Phytophthora kernoviae]|uniref:Uncharacterized protein n=1 Tax=Phytophthora kernoviae TaxID=325452 RepID=A0A421FT69_9STRA|nr:hypothetical protein BBJ29_006504 [Phytophthora kernoviae]